MKEGLHGVSGFSEPLNKKNTRNLPKNLLTFDRAMGFSTPLTDENRAEELPGVRAVSMSAEDAAKLGSYQPKNLLSPGLDRVRAVSIPIEQEKSGPEKGELYLL